MKLLVIGGTVFLGRHLVTAAVAAGHDVTLFNRGEHNPDLYPEVEKLRGDRDGELHALGGRSWDVVVDTCGYVPRVVRQSADLLSDSVERYIFISTISVYADSSTPDMDEDADVGTIADASVEDVTGQTYGPLKALCEQTVEEVLHGRCVIVRPGLIVGKWDPSDRFTYWPHRIAQGGDVLVPGRSERRVQLIDGQDLGAWIIRLGEERRIGVFNATGPNGCLTMGEVVEGCKRVSGSDARFAWVDEQFLLDAQVQPWMELPLWVPDVPDMAGFNSVSIQRAVHAGLQFRPLEDTIRDTLEWDCTRPQDVNLRAGITRQREADLLAGWRKMSAP
jgi:2'-hydroxyisoflavone reductase